MAEFRNIHTRIWKDGWFCDLAPDEKLVFIYLFSNERASVCGMYELALKHVAFETGVNLDRVSEIFIEFEKSGKAYYQSGYVWVVNLRKYNDSGDSIKVRVRIQKDLDAVPDIPLKKRYYEFFQIPYPENKKSQIGYLESATETETETDTETEEEQNQKPSPPSPRVSSSSLRVFSAVTGMSYFPGDPGDFIPKIEAIMRQNAYNENATIDYLRPFWGAWTQRKNSKTKRPYDRKSLGWLDWAIDGVIPDAEPTMREPIPAEEY